MPLSGSQDIHKATKKNYTLQHETPHHSKHDIDSEQELSRSLSFHARGRNLGVECAMRNWHLPSSSIHGSWTTEESISPALVISKLSQLCNNFTLRIDLFKLFLFSHHHRRIPIYLLSFYPTCEHSDQIAVPNSKLVGEKYSHEIFFLSIFSSPNNSYRQKMSPDP